MAQYWYMIVADILLTLVSIIFGLMLRLEILIPAILFSVIIFRSIWPLHCSCNYYKAGLSLLHRYVPSYLAIFNNP